MLRISVTRFMTLARLGRTSLICKPGTALAIGWNSPRTSAGAVGLGSNVSRCDGPPDSQISTQFFTFTERADPGTAPAPARSRNHSSSPSPRNPSDPSRNTSRRLGPRHGRDEPFDDRDMIVSFGGLG